MALCKVGLMQGHHRFVNFSFKFIVASLDIDTEQTHLKPQVNLRTKAIKMDTRWALENAFTIRVCTGVKIPLEIVVNDPFSVFLSFCNIWLEPA